MGQRNHCAMAIHVQRGDHIVGHAAIDLHRGHVPAAVVLLARVDHHHLIIEHARHFRQVTRELAGADQDQPPARPVHGTQDLAVEFERVGPLARR